MCHPYTLLKSIVSRSVELYQLWSPTLPPATAATGAVWSVPPLHPTKVYCVQVHGELLARSETTAGSRVYFRVSAAQSLLPESTARVYSQSLLPESTSRAYCGPQGVFLHQPAPGCGPLLVISLYTCPNYLSSPIRVLPARQI